MNFQSPCILVITYLKQRDLQWSQVGREMNRWHVTSVPSAAQCHKISQYGICCQLQHHMIYAQSNPNFSSFQLELYISRTRFTDFFKHIIQELCRGKMFRRMITAQSVKYLSICITIFFHLKCNESAIIRLIISDILKQKLCLQINVTLAINHFC